MDQTTTSKGTCIKFKMYAECRLWVKTSKKFVEIFGDLGPPKKIFRH